MHGNNNGGNKNMSFYKAIRDLWQDNRKELNREHTIEWRAQPATIRIHRPTRLDRARALGYKAKQGFLIVRQRVDSGGRQRPKIRSGRRSKTFRQFKILDMNYQAVAERRAVARYPNCEVLNSYEVGDDSKHFWFEVILIDRDHPQVFGDKNASGAARQRGRAQRGLTSANRKSRGLRVKGKGAEGARENRKTRNKGHTYRRH
jgi:large subunit ribosomal protein L15e